MDPSSGRCGWPPWGRPRRTRRRCESRRRKGSQSDSLVPFIASFVLGIILRYARLANVGLPAGVSGGLVVGLLVWFGFPLFGMITGGIFEGRPGKLVGLNVSHALVSFLAMGLVLGIWV